MPYRLNIVNTKFDDTENVPFSIILVDNQLLPLDLVFALRSLITAKFVFFHF